MVHTIKFIYNGFIWKESASKEKKSENLRELGDEKSWSAKIWRVTK